MGLNEEAGNVKLPVSGSFGDSYAFGMAGTGGTSSSISPAELWTFLGFAVGKRELDNAGFTRGWRDEFPRFPKFPKFDNLKELRLEFEDSDMPEAYDFRFCSGVPRAEDGVTLFSNNNAGD
jgi:hypothetical protein